MTSPATLDYSGLEDPRCVNLPRNLGCTASFERITEKSGTSAKPVIWQIGLNGTAEIVFATSSGTRHGRQLERASQKRRITAFEIWKLSRLPSTAQKETAGKAAPVRPHAHLKHVRGGSSSAGILDNACGGKVLRSPSAIGFFRGCKPLREFRLTGPPALKSGRSARFSPDGGDGSGPTRLPSAAPPELRRPRTVPDRTLRPQRASPTSATRRQNACNVLIFRSRKPKVGTTRHSAEERGRGTQTQIRGGGWAGKFSLSC